jgi:hypothetical protein
MRERSVTVLAQGNVCDTQGFFDFGIGSLVDVTKIERGSNELEGVVDI